MEEEEIFGLPQIKTLKTPDSGRLRFVSPSLTTSTMQEEEEEDLEKKIWIFRCYITRFF
tara:strand:- start:221 stop:397 length:177 start_codon:yes stop_codon:yes gene_type:complete